MMLPREFVFGGGTRLSCRRCSCIDVFEGLTDECCLVTRGKAWKFEPDTPSASDSSENSASVGPFAKRSVRVSRLGFRRIPCTSCFNGSDWMLRGCRCWHAAVAYMASGRRVDLYPGARSDLARSLGVPPGCLCRRATAILVARTSGILQSKLGHILDRPEVGALPLEY